MLRKNSKKFAFFLNLEKLLTRRVKKNNAADNSLLDELFSSNPTIVEELGPVIGFLGAIFNATVPKEYSEMSASMLECSNGNVDSINDSMSKCRTTPSRTPDLSPRFR